MRENETYDWSKFDVHMLVASDPATVYECWATARGMERFFAREFRFSDPEGRARQAGMHAESGDSYRLAFHHPSELEGRVLAAIPEECFAFTFGDMRVDVTFMPCERGTLIRLVQSDIPTDRRGNAESHLNCRSCWTYYLLNLRSVLEHGHDLRDDGLPDNPVSIHFGSRSVETVSWVTSRRRV